MFIIARLVSTVAPSHANQFQSVPQLFSTSFTVIHWRLSHDCWCVSSPWLFFLLLSSFYYFFYHLFRHSFPDSWLFLATVGCFSATGFDFDAILGPLCGFSRLSWPFFEVLGDVSCLAETLGDSPPLSSVFFFLKLVLFFWTAIKMQRR